METKNEPGSHAMGLPELRRVDLGHLRSARPRLLVTGERVAALRARLVAGDDQAFAAWVDQVREQAEAAERAGPLVRELTEGRLLPVSQACGRRVRATGVMYLLTGERRWAEAGLRAVREVCGFSDWNPGHSLDFCEMAAAVGMGLDWFADAVDEATWRGLAGRLHELAIEPALGMFETGDRLKWLSDVLGDFNWNLVCNGGLIIGSLAVAEQYPDDAERLINLCLEAMPRALVNFAPGGLWPEGQDYWRYALEYLCYTMASLETSVGHDAGIGACRGVLRSGWQGVYLSTPDGDCFRCADIGERFAASTSLWMLQYAADRTGDERLAGWQHAKVARGEAVATPMDVLFYEPVDAGDFLDDLPRFVRMSGNAGRTDVVTYRSGWGDAEAFWWATKTGYNRVNHGHMDLGSFELMHGGVRWAVDLGTDRYSLPGTWARHRDEGKRWQYFRYSSLSHNVIDLDGRNQLLDGYATVESCDETEQRVVLDLSPAYADRAAQVRRTFHQIDPTRLRILDEVEGSDDVSMRWTWMTDAAVRIDGRRVVLEKDGRRLVLAVATSGEIGVISAERDEPEMRNAGMRQVTIEPVGRVVDVTVSAG